MKTNKPRKIANIFLHIFGFALCVLPPIICTLFYFPLWSESAKALSGGVLLLALVSAIPVFKLLKKHFESPASYTVWLFLFIIFFALSKIAAEMTVISFVGFISNALGALMFRMARRKTENE